MKNNASAWDKAVCPGCGWIGSSHSLGPNRSCPRCKDYEGIATIRIMLMGVKRDTKGQPLGSFGNHYDDVDMPKFLAALQKLGLLTKEE